MAERSSAFSIDAADILAEVAAADRLPEIAAEACERARRPDATPADGMHAVVVLLLFGYVERAKAILMELARLPPGGQLKMLRLCRFLLAGRSLLGRGRQEEFGVMVAHNPEARRVILVFPGKGNRFWGFNEDAFINRKDASFIFMRDPGGCFYLNGIKGLGASYPEVFEALRHVIQAVGGSAGRTDGPVLHCVGHSTGGYAALRFGLDLGARGVLAFSAPTNLDFGDQARAILESHSDLRELYERAPGMAVDLRSLYAAAHLTPKVILCYGANHPDDAPAALRMAKLPGVTLEPVAGYDGHDTILEMMKLNLFVPLVDAILAE